MILADVLAPLPHEMLASRWKTAKETLWSFLENRMINVPKLMMPRSLSFQGHEYNVIFRSLSIKSVFMCQFLHKVMYICQKADSILFKDNRGNICLWPYTSHLILNKIILETAFTPSRSFWFLKLRDPMGKSQDYPNNLSKFLKLWERKTGTDQRSTILLMLPQRWELSF